MNQSDFLKVTTPFKDKVFRLSLRMLVSKEAAEDATQELFLKLWNIRNKLCKYKSVEAFAMTLAKNYCFDILKSKQNNNLSLIHTNFKASNVQLDKRIEQLDAVSLVHQLMSELPEKQKIIIHLRDVEQYDFDEICEIVDMKSTAVRVALSRARKTIREALILKNNYGIR